MADTEKKPREKYKFRQVGRSKTPNPYKIIITSNGSQREFVGSYANASTAKRKFAEMAEDGERVAFPVKYVNFRKITEANYEALLLRRRTAKDAEASVLRDETGRLVEHVVGNDEEWVIEAKMPYHKEETFWVWGYHPSYQRKDFNFIFDEILARDAESKFHMKQVLVYLNKLLILEDAKTDIVICKCEPDAIRLYTALEKKVSGMKKIRGNIVFCGFVGRNMVKRVQERIMAETGWNLRKVKRSSTRP